MIREKVRNGLGYDEYKELVEELLSQNKTTGQNQSEAYVDYTKMAFQRIKKWEKTTKLQDSTVSFLENLKGEYIWLMIAEAWCGDVGQNLAPFHLMAQVADIELKLVLRDENLDLMDQFLTNGGRSIPKVLVLDKHTHQVLGDWGPRPDFAQTRVMEAKDDPNISSHELHKEIHLWYALNKHHDLQSEVIELMTEVEKNL